VKKILFISLALVLALSVGLIGCEGDGDGVEAPEAILVGLVRDLDGPLLFYDQTSGGPTYRAFNKTVNADGGIYMSEYGEKLPLELKIKNYDPTSPGDIELQTEALITVDKVHFMWGGPGTETIYQQSPTCNANGILLMTLEGGATEMMTEPTQLPSWPYTWVNLSFSDWYQIPVLHKMLLEQSLPGGRDPQAYVVYINNPHGYEYRDVAIDVFGAGNVTTVLQATDATTDDIEDIIEAAQTAFGDPGNPNYDIFCGFSYAPFIFHMVTSSMALDFDPPAMILGPGSTGGAFSLIYGPNTEGVLGFTVANNKTDVSPEDTTMTFAEMWDLIMQEGTDPMTPPGYVWDVWGHPVQWAGLEMWKAAVEKVGHLDVGYSAEVRSVLAGYTEEDPCTTVMGDCWYEVFGGGTGGGVIHYQSMPGQIGQWQDDYVETVGYSTVTDDIPKYDITAPFVYPMSGNWTWI
jgi:hypothetical protein